MNQKSLNTLSRRRAFTLIELLVVVTIIVILAGLILSGITGSSAAKIKSRMRGELMVVQTAIDTYKQELGYYPPDNPGLWNTNQLYFELSGTYQTNNGSTVSYVTLDESASIADNQFQNVFGSKVTGFMNCTRSGGEETRVAVNFLKGTLRDGQFQSSVVNGSRVAFLGTSLTAAKQDTYNRWSYNSSSPTNNAGTYDLWVDVEYKGQTNRFCNWANEPFVPAGPGE